MTSRTRETVAAVALLAVSCAAAQIDSRLLAAGFPDAPTRALQLLGAAASAAVAVGCAARSIGLLLVGALESRRDVQTAS